MKSKLPLILESSRIHDPRFEAQKEGDRFGLFKIVYKGARLQIIASCSTPELPWDHVSVRGHGCTPTWEQMDYVCRLFWDDDECVVQFHPPRSDHVNIHPHVLHMWKADVPFPMPPKECV